MTQGRSQFLQGMSELAPALCTKRHVFMAVHSCVLWRQMSSLHLLYFCAEDIRLHLEKGLGHNKQLYLHAHTDKHTHMHLHTSAHTHVHMDMRRHIWNIPCFLIYIHPQGLGPSTFCLMFKSLSACTHRQSYISLSLPVCKKGTPTRSVSHPLS